MWLEKRFGLRTGLERRLAGAYAGWSLAALAMAGATAVAAPLAGPPAQAAAAPAGVMVTVYSSADPASFDPRQWIFQTRQGFGAAQVNPDAVPGFGVVKQVRMLRVAAGVNKVNFTDVAALIDPTSVSFQDLTAPSTQVLEQQFKFDLVNTRSVLAKYIGHTVTARLPVGNRGFETLTGKLFHYGHSMILQTRHGIQILYPGFLQQVSLAALPRGLITQPTLQWRLWSAQAGEQKVLTSYQTKGLTWIADYNLTLDPKNTHARLAAWVTLLNLSGKTYRQAHLKLIAGSVHRVPPYQAGIFGAMAMRQAANLAAPRGFQQKRFFEYHMYTLPRPTTIANNSTEQIALFPTRQRLGVRKVLIFSGQLNTYWWNYAHAPDLNQSPGIHYRAPVSVLIRFMNSKANGLGLPLPRGKIRVFQEDPADGTLEFVGEDLIPNTPRGERVSVKVGKAFDIIGSRTQTNFHVDQVLRTLRESFKIVLHNHQNQAVGVLVPQVLYRWSNWKIIASSAKFRKINSRTIRFHAEIPPHGVAAITYTVRYSW